MSDSREKEREILAGSVVVLPASPIGLCEKAGMREKDWNRKGEREKTERGNSCGLAHSAERGVACPVFTV